MTKHGHVEAIAAAVADAVVDRDAKVAFFDPAKLARVMRAITSQTAREELAELCTQEMYRQIQAGDGTRAFAALKLSEKVEQQVGTTWVLGPDGDLRKLP